MASLKSTSDPGSPTFRPPCAILHAPHLQLKKSFETPTSKRGGSNIIKQKTNLGRGKKKKKIMNGPYSPIKNAVCIAQPGWACHYQALDERHAANQPWHPSWKVNEL